MRKINEKKNWNILALRGLEMDDMDFIKKNRMNPMLAYTPQLNPELIKFERKRNLHQAKLLGMPIEMATKIANENANQVINDTNHLYKALKINERITKKQVFN